MARSLTWHCCPWCLTEEEKTAARIDQEINKILLEQKKRDRGELKLLLLGESRAWRAGRGKRAGGQGPGLRGGRTWEPIRQMGRLRHREPRFLVQTWVQPSCGASARTEVAPRDGLVGPAPAWQAQHALPALCHGKGAMSSGLPLSGPVRPGLSLCHRSPRPPSSSLAATPPAGRAGPQLCRLASVSFVGGALPPRCD